MTTQQTSIKYLSNLLRDGRAVSMVQAYRSRTGRKRGYRLFVSNGERIEDITPFVCKAIVSTWNNVQGTYDTSEQTWNGSDDDAISLCNKLSEALDVGLVPVLTL